MSWQTGLYFGTVLAAFAVSAFLNWQAWNQRNVPGSRFYFWLAAAMCVAMVEEALDFLYQHGRCQGSPARTGPDRPEPAEEKRLRMLQENRADELLCMVAKRLQGCMRKSDTAARFGGDEFTIFNGDIANLKDSEKIAQKVLRALSEPFVLASRTVRLIASHGISIFPFDGDDPKTFLEHADKAMFRSKRKRNSFWFHHPSEE